MDFAKAMEREGSYKLTENGALAYDNSGKNALLDFFSQAGALRSRSVEEIENKFAAAYRANPLLATKAMFYTGDIRQGGLGERRTFRICLKWMAENHPAIVNKNMELIPYYNRFDSWFELVGTSCEGAMWEQVATTLIADLKALENSSEKKIVPISLLAKWMPSENTSSQATRRMARSAMKVMKLRPREYRKMLTKLRKHINVVESLMSAGQWDKIDYAKVPSYAMHNYGFAFAKHDHERFDAYLKNVKKGKTKINAGTLYPYDLVHSYMKDGHFGWRNTTMSEDPVVEAQWRALPNYLTKDINAVVMADISGSMQGRPMETSIGLAIYFAQHNKGAYHNKYMTFSREPSFEKISEGASLYKNVSAVASKGGLNTNLEAAFRLILDTAIQYKVPAEEMPEALIVISDMEIDPYFHSNRSWDFVEVQKRKFAKVGYHLPKLIMFNVEARQDTFLSQNENVILLSGQSASTFKNLCGTLDGKTAYDFMVEILNGKAYDKVKI